MVTITVKARELKYPVLVGQNLLSRLNVHLSRHVRTGRLCVVYDANVYALYGDRIRKAIGLRSVNVKELVIPFGECYKVASTLDGVYDFLLSQKLSRGDFVLACGGGVTSDLVGYAAATALRGLRWSILSTTVIGMADASIGGKTGINHRLGKNLIGAFWPPSFVLADTAFLATLPPRHVVAGLGELLKCAGLAGGSLAAHYNNYIAIGQIDDWKQVTRLLVGAARYKAAVVSRDEFEAGERRALNFGHTFAHALEQAGEYRQLLHGEAVIIGIAAALEAGRRLGIGHPSLDAYAGVVDRTMRLVSRRKINLDAALEAIQFDKKRSEAAPRLVLLERLGCPVITDSIDARILRSALTAALERYRAIGGHHGESTHSSRS